MNSTEGTSARTDAHSTRGAYVTGGAEFNRDTNYIEDRITRDGRPAITVSRGGRWRPAATG